MSKTKICTMCKNDMEYNSNLGEYFCSNCGCAVPLSVFIDSDIKPGMIFKGNINGAKLEVLRIEEPTTRTESGNIFKFPPRVILRDLKTNRTSHYGLDAFKHCDLTFISK